MQSNEQNSAVSYFKVFSYQFALCVFFVLLRNETGEDLADSLQIFTPHVAEIHKAIPKATREKCLLLSDVNVPVF